MRSRAARTLEFPPTRKGGFLLEAQSVVLPNPPGTGKTRLATALGIVAARRGHRVLLVTATDWVTASAKRTGKATSQRARPAAPLRADHTSREARHRGNNGVRLTSCHTRLAPMLRTKQPEGSQRIGDELLDSIHNSTKRTLRRLGDSRARARSRLSARRRQFGVNRLPRRCSS